MAAVQELKEKLRDTVYSLDDPDVIAYLQPKGYSIGEHRGVNGAELLKRPNIHALELLELAGEETDSELAEKCEIDIKYEGYINKARREAQRLKGMENIPLGTEFNYDEVDNLSLEGRQKLMKYQPATIGQASRISGVNPADIAVLAIAIKQGKGRRKPS